MYITADIGGTQLRISVFGKSAVDTVRLKTPNYLQGYSEDEANEKIIGILSDVIIKNKACVDSVGICFPGPVSLDGKVWGSSVIYGKALREPFDLYGSLIKKTGFENITVINDLSAASLYFADKYSKYSVITVSSGVGGKIVINKELQISDDGLEGEIGHIPTALCPEINIPCSCGTGYNHIGCISSGRGIADVAAIAKDTFLSDAYKASAVKGEALKTESLLAAADKGDPFSKSVVDYCTKPLAYEINTLLSAMYLEKVILIGGVISNSEYYFRSLLDNMYKIGVYNYSRQLLKEKLEVAEGDDFGLLGMYKIIKDKRKK